MARVLEAASIEDRALYGQILDEILFGLDRLNIDADKATIALFTDLRRQTSDIISDLAVDSLSGPLYQRTLDGIDQAMTDFANRWGLNFEAQQLAAFNLGEELGLAPLEAGAGLEFARFGPSTDQLRILAQFRTDLVGGVTDDIRKRIRNEVAAFSVGAKSFSDAARAIGRNLDDPNHFRTVMHRARAILQTETGRAQAIATQGAQLRAAEDVPNLRKRWINAHLPGSRPSHLSAEARYAENGTVGPIPVEEPFTIAGISAMYPHDPSLPASESVHCKCVVISVLVDPSLKPGETDPSPAPPEPLAKADKLRQDEEERSGGGLTARQTENVRRFQRLTNDMTKPAEWSKWSNAKRLRWLEDTMEADFPIGEEWRKIAIQAETQTWTDARGKRRRRTRNVPVSLNPGDDLPTVFDLKGMDADLAFDNMQELRRLGSSFPEVAERLSYVGTYRGTKAVPWKTRGNQFGGEYAHASHDGARLGLNPKHYGDPGEFRSSRRYGWGTGFKTVGSDVGTMAHEFGHHVENWLGREGSRSLVPVGSRADAFATVSGIRNALHDIATDGYSGFGGYATHSRAEGFAETFSTYWHRKRRISWIAREARVDALTGDTIPPLRITGAEPAAGNAYATPAERWLDRFTRFMDLLEGSRLSDLPKIQDLDDFQLLSPADRALHDELRNQLIDDLGGDLPGVSRFTLSIEEFERSGG